MVFWVFALTSPRPRMYRSAPAMPSPDEISSRASEAKIEDEGGEVIPVDRAFEYGYGRVPVPDWAEKVVEALVDGPTLSGCPDMITDGWWTGT